jgi:hypothetical protein
VQRRSVACRPSLTPPSYLPPSPPSPPSLPPSLACYAPLTPHTQTPKCAPNASLHLPPQPPLHPTLEPLSLHHRGSVMESEVNERHSCMRMGGVGTDVIAANSDGVGGASQGPCPPNPSCCPPSPHHTSIDSPALDLFSYRPSVTSEAQPYPLTLHRR